MKASTMDGFLFHSVEKVFGADIVVTVPFDAQAAESRTPGKAGGIPIGLSR